MLRIRRSSTPRFAAKHLSAYIISSRQDFVVKWIDHLFKEFEVILKLGGRFGGVMHDRLYMLDGISADVSATTLAFLRILGPGWGYAACQLRSVRCLNAPRPWSTGDYQIRVACLSDRFLTLSSLKASMTVSKDMR